MANPFDPKAKYKPSRDVRDWDDLFARVQDPPDGLFWPVLGPRRSGKTWALKALAHRSEDCTYIDAGKSPQLPAECSAKLILLDELGSFLFEEPPQGQRSHRHVRDDERTAELFAWCQTHKQRGASIVAAVTASEWAAFPKSGRDGVDLNELDSDALAPLTDAQAQALAGDDERSKACVDALLRDAPDWSRNPLLLTALLHCRCKDEQLDLEGLLLAARRYVENEFDYTARVLYEGFDPSQQEAIRATARNQDVAADLQTLLIRSGVAAEDDGVMRIADPVLAEHLPAPTRIHHISDLHFGSKTAQAVDGKDNSELGQLLAQGAGAAPVRDDYLEWLTSLRSRRRPNIVVVSGDLAEWAKPEEFEEAQAWLSKLVDKGTAAHPDVDDGPRLLFVGGNHDVDWGASQAVTETRHEPLASYFPRDAWHRPGLEHPKTTSDGLPTFVTPKPGWHLRCWAPRSTAVKATAHSETATTHATTLGWCTTRTSTACARKTGKKRSALRSCTTRSHTCLG